MNNIFNVTRVATGVQALFGATQELHEQYHTVRGRKRFGLIMDPGASSRVVGTDTCLDYARNVLGARDQRRITIEESTARFAGIDGEETRGLGHINMPLGLPGWPNATYKGDMLGEEDSRCPFLVPLPTFI